MKKLTVLLLLVFLAASFSQAQQRYNELTYPELNEFQKPQVETFTADNGIKFFLVEDNELPLININVDIRTGGVVVPNEKAGLAAITGTVIRSGGTEKYPADELNVLLENSAASIETWIGFSSGGAQMSVLKKDFEKLLPVFVDLLANPALPKDKIELAKTQQKTGISRRNTRSQQIGVREFTQLIYGETSVYGRTAEYETVNNITREDLVNLHDKYFIAENLMVGIVGDFEALEMKEKLKKAFADFPNATKANLNFPEVNYQSRSTINFVNKSNINQSFVMMGHLGGLRSNPDYAEIQVMNEVLSGGFSGRLFKVVRTEMGLAYAVLGQYTMNAFYPGFFFAAVMTKSATTTEAIDAIIKQIERLQNEPISPEELQATKDQILNSAVFEYDSYEQVLYQQMSYEYLGLPANSFEQYLEDVKATTVEDVQRVAQEYLHPNQLQILVVGNKEQIGDQLQKYGDVNIIDITIPKPDGDTGQKVVKGDAKKGAEHLSKMADAIITPGTNLDKLTTIGTMALGPRKVKATSVIDYPGSMKMIMELPTGKMVLALKDGKATMTMAGNTRTLPASSPMVSNLKAGLNRNIVAIALKADKLNPQYLGTEEFEGKTYNKLSVKIGGKNITLLLDQETNLLRVMRFQQFSPQMGKQVTVERRFSDWTTNEGVTFPYTQATYVSGKERATATYTEHSVN